MVRELYDCMMNTIQKQEHQILTLKKELKHAKENKKVATSDVSTFREAATSWKSLFDESQKENEKLKAQLEEALSKKYNDSKNKIAEVYQ
jgi:predicted nuclease with TOPRIM domain